METAVPGNLKPSKGKAFWEDHINHWQRGELSKIAYCRAHGLAPSTLDSWRRKLQQPVPDKKKPEDFLSLQLQQTAPLERGFMPAATAPAGIEIQFPQGINIKINSTIDHDVLFQVLQLVRRLP
jgi:hypothetical protein